MKDDVHRSILENGLDFLLHSIRPPIDPEEDVAWEVLPKYLVLNPAAATELILKARLCKEHWSLIFQNPDTASADCLHSGEFSSASYDSCVIRLERICGIAFAGTEREILRELRARRNCYQHLRATPDPITVTPLGGKVLDFLLDFLETRFEPNDLTADANESLSALRPCLSQFRHLRETRLAQLSSQLHPLLDAGRVEQCLVCSERTLELNPTVRCHFCHWSASAVEAALSQSEVEEARRKESLYQPSLFPMPPLPFVSIFQCERCGVNAVVSRSADESAHLIESWKCYSCGAANDAGTA